jgi:glutamyl-Q tRNA(Asp) synthetase
MDRTKRHTAIETNQPYIGRFAPTPSGALHLGSLVAALGSYLDARAHNGIWKLRIDDLDEQRCQPATTDRIITQLSAHGMVPDGEIVRQRSRQEVYTEALTKLGDIALTYRCCCTRKQLRDAMQIGLAAEGLAGPIYPGTCRGLAHSEHEMAGIRFIVPQEIIKFTDRFLGQIEQSLPTTIGDPILRRSDGVFAYHLAEVVDNRAMGITHVVRGADLSPLTPLHIALHHALFPDTPSPVYGHLPLVMGSNGLKLSKTNQAPALDVRRARENLSAAAGHLGLETPTAHADIEEMLADWAAQWAHRHRISKDS